MLTHNYCALGAHEGSPPRRIAAAEAFFEEGEDGQRRRLSKTETLNTLDEIEATFQVSRCAIVGITF